MAHSMLSLLCSRPTMASAGNESAGVGRAEVRMGEERERVGVEEREEERDATRDGTLSSSVEASEAADTDPDTSAWPVMVHVELTP